MTDILHQLVRYMVTQLLLTENYDDVFGLCFVSEDGDIKQVERYAYVDAPDPQPAIVTPTDGLGTYMYIREFDDEVTGEQYINYEDSSCGISGATVTKKLRAVVVSDKLCYPVELATRLVNDIQDISFRMFTRYQTEDVRIRYVAERNGVKSLYEIETGCKPKSENVQMASFDFEITFNYPTSCVDELPNIC